ncbi:PREDICTED: uncharacterized protein LOC105151746 isoform X3 [Acromyrmex echinatior]|uniref:uncharacterized protein LOC105151746 isoform X3 n=1 Tax=Acromyrmex echinatior TaxID=103372 RepID=UPI000580CC24|nr:PREDICTED: uncharacterized protein LOC105151746 isoform X3 [Acromyrmex echinatior]
METFEAYDESMVTAANYQCDIVQTVNNHAPKEEIEVRNRENHDTLTLQQQQTEQMHQVTQIESNIQQKATAVRLPALLDGEYFQVIRVEDTNVTRLHPSLMSKIRCKSSQRKPAIYVNSTLPDKCSEIMPGKRAAVQNKKRCKTQEECTAEKNESYEQHTDWNDTSLIRGSDESESADPSLRISHNNSFIMEDEYDAIGRNVAAKLRNMRLDQRIIAEKLLNDILFEAQLGNLHRDSSIHV